VRNRILIIAHWCRINAQKALIPARELYEHLRGGVIEGLEKSAADKLLGDDEEFRPAVRALEGARRSVYTAVEKEASEIWWQTRETRWPLIGSVVGYSIPFVALIISLLYLANSAVNWCMDNWVKNASLLASLSELFASAIDGWYSTGQPDRWIYVLGSVAFAAIAWRIFRAALSDIPVMLREWQEDLRDEMRPPIRVELNKLTNEKYPRTLPFLRAPGLGEISSPYRLIAREELERIKRWNEELGASAIAISGYRGVGKTTLLKSMIDSTYRAERDTPVTIFVAAPVTYDSREFLILLYSRLCEKVIGLTGAEKTRGARLLQAVPGPIRTLLQLTIRFGLLLALAWAWLPFLPVPALHSISATVFATAIFITGWWLSAKLSIPRSSIQAPPDITREAEEELRRMHLLQTVSVETSAGVKRGSIDLGKKRARQLAERPSTLPELVESYREFAEQVATWLHSRRRARLLICIDEVDRISKAEDAEAFINDIKAIFGVKYCVYLVTVSEEALAGFERRVVRLRPALDSAFDEVLRLDVFTVGQSLELLRRHVVGFSDIFISLCHCLAGGIPRDLVREARALLDETNEARFDLERSSSGKTSDKGKENLTALTAATVTRSVKTLKRGLVARAAMTETVDEQWPGTLPLLISEAWPGEPRNEMFRSLTVLYQRGYNDRTSVDLCAAVFFYATVYDIFTGQFAIMTHDFENEKSMGAKVVDRLATVRGLLALSPTMAIEELIVCAVS
jgi:hypothetical protein